MITPYNQEKIDHFFTKLMSSPINCFKIENANTLPSEFFDFLAEPNFFDFMVEKYSNSQYSSVDEIITDFELFTNRIIAAAEKLPDKSQDKLIVTSLAQTIKVKFSPKLRHACNDEYQDRIEAFDKSIEELTTTLKNIPSSIYEDEFQSCTTKLYEVPRKVFPVYQ